MGRAGPHRWTEPPGAAREPGGTVATPPDICTRRACPGRDGARNVKPPNLRRGGPGASWPRGQPSGQRKRRSEGRARNGDMCDRAEAREAPMQFGTLDPSTLQAYHTRPPLSTTRCSGPPPIVNPTPAGVEARRPHPRSGGALRSRGPPLREGHHAEEGQGRSGSAAAPGGADQPAFITDASRSERPPSPRAAASGTPT